MIQMVVSDRFEVVEQSIFENEKQLYVLDKETQNLFPIELDKDNRLLFRSDEGLLTVAISAHPIATA